MTTEATQQGARQVGDAPVTEKAFPEKDPKGIDSGQKTDDDMAVMMNPRAAALAAIEAAIDGRRESEIEESQREYYELVGEDAEQLRQEGLQSRSPAEGQNVDPLAEYIVIGDNGAPMFKTKVDGEERLVPLDAARTQLQKHVAADIRLQQAATANKTLEAREAQIRQQEAALVARTQQAATASPSNSQDVSDQGFENDAREVVSSLFTGSEDEAVNKLTKLLNRSRQANSPRVSQEDLVKLAADAARRARIDAEAEIAEANRITDINEGFKDFKKDFREIAEDPNLFRYADSLTDVIEAEHPEWSPSKIMAEAGRKTNEWLQSLKGGATEQVIQPTGREKIKQQLKPLPRAASAQAHSDKQESAIETPHSVIEEVRRLRGQG
jgi:hypothetical protein